MCDGSVDVIMNNSQTRDELQANICILERDFGNTTLLVFLVTQKKIEEAKRSCRWVHYRKKLSKKSVVVTIFANCSQGIRLRWICEKNVGWRFPGQIKNQMAIIYRTIPAPPNAEFLSRLWSAPILCSPPLPPTPSRFFAIPPPLPLPPGLINVL